MELDTKYIVDENGKPTSVIPIDKFREIVETYGIDLTEEEKKSINRGKILRRRNDKDELEKEYKNIDAINFRGDIY